MSDPVRFLQPDKGRAASVFGHLLLDAFVPDPANVADLAEAFSTAMLAPPSAQGGKGAYESPLLAFKSYRQALLLAPAEDNSDML